MDELKKDSSSKNSDWDKTEKLLKEDAAMADRAEWLSIGAIILSLLSLLLSLL